MPAAAGPAAEIHDEHDRKFEPLRRMNRHQADRVAGVDDGVRLVTGRQPLEVLGKPRHRRVAAVLDAANHRADFLQVFSRLSHARPARLEHVRGFVEHQLEHLGGRQTIDETEPSRDALARALEDEAIFAIERREVDGPARQRGCEVRGKRLQRRDPRAARIASAGTPRRANSTRAPRDSAAARGRP